MTAPTLLPAAPSLDPYRSGTDVGETTGSVSPRGVGGVVVDEMGAAASPAAESGARRGAVGGARLPVLYIPALIVAAAPVTVAVLGVQATGGGRLLAQTVTQGWSHMLGPAVLAFVGLVLVMEQVRPAVRRPLLARGHVQDLAYFVLYALAVVPLIVVIDLGFSQLLGHVAPWLAFPRLSVVPRLALLGLAVLLMDGCNWFAHWANHRWTPLWRFHAVHHSQEELTILTSFRAHPLVHASFLVSVIPVVMLSSSVALPTTVITVYICLSSLPHANLRWTFGPLGKLVVSPAYHRLHHADEGRIDLNLGTVLTVWDVLSHRAVFPTRGAAPISTGLQGRQVPVEQSGSLHRPLGTLAVQLVEPFIPSTASDRELSPR